MKKDKTEFDLEGSVDINEAIEKLQKEKEALEKLNFQYEYIIRKNGLEAELNKEFSDEEFICVKGIQSIKSLVNNDLATKDHINMFDVLYRNLNTIRGINLGNKKKEKPKSREELLKVIKGNG